MRLLWSDLMDTSTVFLLGQQRGAAARRTGALENL